MIDGELVSGAACVEDHTPLDRPDGDGVIVSDLYEERRNSGKMVIDPATSAALLELAGRFVSEMSAEEPLMLNYSLDLAMTPDGPVVIELNAANDSGLYANDAGVIMRAELRQVERRPELVGESETSRP